jgi:hypothetical protein
MRALAVLCCVAATCLQAQQPPPPQSPQPPPTADSARAESARTPLPPSADQQRFLSGLRTATRGIAQLKDGLNRVARAQAAGDSVSQRRAGRSFAGLCGSARTFMRRGRPSLKPTVYSDSVQLVARRLVSQLDSLIAFTTSCEQSAVSTPGPAATDLGKRMKTYDLALRDFRLAVGLPVKEDTAKTGKR